VEALIEIAEKHNVLPGQVALNWLITFSGNTVVAIPGASKVAHAQQSAGAMNFVLSAEDCNRIDELSRPFLNQ
jgi:aryl-alcohol dehydrogenase-like predicted oxidoreductase